MLATFWKNSPNSVRAGAVRSLIKVLHGPAAAERALVNENVLIDLEDMGGKPPPGLFSVVFCVACCLCVCLCVWLLGSMPTALLGLLVCCYRHLG